LFATVLFGLYSVMSIIPIAIGAINLDTCKIQSMIPLWLLVNGTVSFIMCGLKFWLNIFAIVNKRKNPDKEPIQFLAQVSLN